MVLTAVHEEIYAQRSVHGRFSAEPAQPPQSAFHSAQGCADPLRGRKSLLYLSGL